MTGDSVKYLTAVLNSQLLTFAFRAFYAGGDLRGNTFRYKKVFLENLPIINLSGEGKICFECLVDYLQLCIPQDQKLQAAYFEQLIDGLVYELYFPEELKKAGKEILPHLGQLSPLTDSMNKEKNWLLSSLSLTGSTIPAIPSATTWKPWIPWRKSESSSRRCNDDQFRNSHLPGR